MKTGIERIVEERQRQFDEEGCTLEHDDGYDKSELAYAAIAYAAPITVYRSSGNENGIEFRDVWPWQPQWDKRPYDDEIEERRYGDDVTIDERLRCLEKSGALIAAEMDRLLRVQLENVTSDSSTNKWQNTPIPYDVQVDLRVRNVDDEDDVVLNAVRGGDLAARLRDSEGNEVTDEIQSWRYSEKD